MPRNYGNKGASLPGLQDGEESQRVGFESALGIVHVRSHHELILAFPTAWWPGGGLDESVGFDVLFEGFTERDFAEVVNAMRRELRLQGFWKHGIHLSPRICFWDQL